MILIKIYKIYIFLLLIPAVVGAQELNTQQSKEKRMEFQGESVIKVRTPEAVAKRTLALLAMVSRVHETNTDNLFKWVSENKIDSYFTQREKSIFFQKELTHEEMVEYSWRAEALISLLWALNVIEQYPNLKDQADIYGYQSVSAIIKNPANFIATAELRDIKEIEDKEADLYHQHWRVRDAQLFNKPMPLELEPGIVYERRYGLSWVAGWGDSWEDVPTDT